MLDTINYVKNNDGSYTKTVTSVSDVADLGIEIAALQAQLAAFEQGQISQPSDSIAAAIANYQAQLSILEA